MSQPQVAGSEPSHAGGFGVGRFVGEGVGWSVGLFVGYGGHKKERKRFFRVSE